MSWAKGRPGPALPLLLLLALLLPHPLYAAPPLLSLLVPWADAEAPPTGALENLGEAPYLASPAEDDSRLHALLGGGRVPAGAEEWETPRSPDLFLLTEVGAEGARPRAQGRRPLDDPQDAVGGRRKRDGFISGAGGSRVRTGGVGGGFAGSTGMRVGAYGGAAGGGGRALGGGGRGLSEGPSLSIVNPLDVLRQRLLLEIARRRMRESEDQIQANRELLKSIGKREAADGPKAPSSM
ncbi:pupal cuticle protein 36 [Ischnura elegans]|uniref:pupal cuticle protein 36 n=1 Tax=Ischnura elegans TaxID=197161 RepID=UPI001ED88614|nr:pupal cuticle protein 36 [Ischnura elegans]